MNAKTQGTRLRQPTSSDKASAFLCFIKAFSKNCRYQISPRCVRPLDVCVCACTRVCVCGRDGPRIYFAGPYTFLQNGPYSLIFEMVAVACT
jgi:hypothetical protein